MDAALLPGEVVIDEVEVRRVNPPSALLPHTEGHLFVTNYQLVFLTTAAAAASALRRQSDQSGSGGLRGVGGRGGAGGGARDATDGAAPAIGGGSSFRAPLASVLAIHAISNSGWVFPSRKRSELTARVKAEDIEAIDITFKTLRRFEFSVAGQPAEVVKKLVMTLLHHSFPTSVSRLFAFDYQPAGPGADKTAAESESAAAAAANFLEQRKALFFREMARCGGDHRDVRFLLSEGNLSYDHCKSYPAIVVVPQAVSDDDMRRSAALFQDGRFPVWVWGSPQSHVWLCRSGQPVASGDRWEAEDPVFAALTESCGKPTVVSASACCPADQVLSGFERLLHLCASGEEQAAASSPEDNRWLSQVNATRWLHMMQRSLVAAVSATATLRGGRKGGVVIVGDGTGDADALVSSLTQLLLDPFLRTRQGFQLLVAKDWIAMGHRFNTRCRHSTQTGAAQAMAPTFLLFLDCVRVVMEQFPVSFEFTELFLLDLWDAVTACKHGTFLLDSDLERVGTPGFLAGTSSVWDELEARGDKAALDLGHINLLYSQKDAPLVPSTSFALFSVWRACFLRGRAGVLSADSEESRNDDRIRAHHQLLLGRLRSLLDQRARLAGNADTGDGAATTSLQQLIDAGKVPAAVGLIDDSNGTRPRAHGHRRTASLIKVQESPARARPADAAPASPQAVSPISEGSAPDAAEVTPPPAQVPNGTSQRSLVLEDANPTSPDTSMEGDDDDMV